LRKPEHQGQKLEDYPNIKRWFGAIHARPAVQRAHAAVEEAGKRHVAMRETV
jgi:GST-like protein